MAVQKWCEKWISEHPFGMYNAYLSKDEILGRMLPVFCMKQLILDVC